MCLNADLLCVMFGQFFSTTASLHGLSEAKHSRQRRAGTFALGPAGRRRRLHPGAVVSRFCPNRRRRRRSGPVQMKQAAVGPAAASSSAAEQQPAGPFHEGGQWEQDAADGRDVEAFSQPGDSLMRGIGGESFMSAASQLRGSSAAADSPAAAAASGATWRAAM